ncbi:MAG: Gfo/Idh/MocA family oxidoreductase [Armatimonadetes bacterium]|nr:Gfo/Idh/MocA family oxidoreductase [Armatimonadota bacterium]
MTDQNSLQLAMIGCGDISERFFKQAEALDDVQFVATCARHLDSAERKGREHGVDRWYDDYERMMDEVKPDGVVVTTPHSLHAAPVQAALRRGIHVLNEKPMATSLDDCIEMERLARENGLVFMQLPFDHTPAFLTALEYLNESTLGKFTGAEAVLLIPGPPRDNWYYDRSVAHGGAMLDCMVYPTSRLISLLGPAKRVTGFVNTLIPHRIVGGGKRVESDVDDNVTLLVEWETGQQAVIRSLWGTSFARNDTAVYGRKGTLWMSGSGIVVHSPEGPIPGAEPVEWQGFRDCYRVPVSPDAPNESMIEHFAASIRENRPPYPSGTLQLHVHEILFKGYRAAETGEAQELTTTFTPWHEVEPSFYDTRGEFI